MLRGVMRAIAIVVLLGGALTTTTGCVTFGACPAIGWTNAVALDTSAVAGVVSVQFCVEGECSPAPGTEPTSSTNLFMVTPQDDGTWVLGLDMSTPDVIDLRLFDAQNTLIHESEVSISWTHSTEPCGGPATADPIVVEP